MPFQFFDPLMRNCVSWELRCKAASPRLPLFARRIDLLLATVEFAIEFERAVLKNKNSLAEWAYSSAPIPLPSVLFGDTEFRRRKSIAARCHLHLAGGYRLAGSG